MKAKKIVAIVTAVTMVLGCGITAMATGGSGSTTARGSSSQHVDRTYVSVTLPLSGTSTFNYIADPERIIQETVDTGNGFTAGGEYVNPIDEGIYFVTSSAATNNIYANQSLALTAYNNSSLSVDLTVTVSSDYDADAIQFADSIDNKYTGVPANDTIDDSPKINMNLVTMVTTGNYTGSTLDIANDGVKTPVLYDGDDTNIATVTATLSGNKDNFKVKSKAGRYVYEPTDIDPKDTSWTKLDFCLIGECSYSDISRIGTAAPDMEVTWSWEDPNATESRVSSSTLPANRTVSVNLPSGVTVTKVALINTGVDVSLTSGNQYSVSGNDYTFISDASTTWKTAGHKIRFTFSDGETFDVTL